MGWKGVFRSETAQQFHLLQRRSLGFGNCKDFGSLTESDFIGVVGWKPNYCPEILIKREKKGKHIVCLVVKERKEQDHV